MSDLDGDSVDLGHDTVTGNTSPGAVLKQVREERGVTLDKIAKHLCLSQQIVANIESGQHLASISPAYLRGYYRAYALAMGLDPTSILPPPVDTVPSSYASLSLSESLDKTPLSDFVQRVSAYVSSPKQRIGLVVTVVGVLAIGSLFIHRLLRHSSHQASAVVPTVIKAKATPAATQSNSVVTTIPNKSVLTSGMVKASPTLTVIKASPTLTVIKATKKKG